MGFEVETIKPKIGARIHADRDTLLEPGTAEKLRALLEDRTVLVFPGIGLSDEDQLALTDNLGPRVYYSGAAPGRTAAAPDVYKLTLDPDINDHPELVHGNFFWHFDGGQSHAAPPAVTILSARSVAAKGGETEFANTYAGYESLADEEKEEIEDLTAIHNFAYGMMRFIDNPTDEDRKRWELGIRAMRGQDPVKDAHDPIPKKHPLVWRHKSGRRSLLLSYGISEVEGMPIPHGRALVSRLLDWCVQPDFRYRHKWNKGDLLMWNNPGAIHRVLPYDERSGRVMHRTTVGGTEIPS